MNRQPVLEGERLVLRPLRLDDWDALYAVARDPLIWEVHPASDRWQEPVFRDYFADALDKRGALAVIERAGGRMIGSSRYQAYAPADGGVVEIGWTFLARSHWGGSWNAEMKQLMLRHALQSVDRVVFRVGEDNGRSRAAMQRIGARLTERNEVASIAGREVRHVIYEITRASFATGPLAAETS